MAGGFGFCGLTEGEQEFLTRVAELIGQGLELTEAHAQAREELGYE